MGAEPPRAGQLTAAGAALLEQTSTYDAWGVRSQVQRKIQGYRSQDRRKRPDSEQDDLCVDGVLEDLLACKLRCFYCAKPVKLLYTQSRDPAQWTLDRIDNSRTHTRTNTVIACMRCNLSRRTQDSAAYKDVKQMVVVREKHADN